MIVGRRGSVWRVVVPLVLGIAIAAVSTQSTFFDDPIPPPGVAYRGLPLPFLKGKPLHGGNRRWEVRWERAAFDVLAWSALSYWILAYGIFRRPTPRPGHCQTCSYDLTGNTSGVCPECGEVDTSSPEEEVGG
jgi:hypothetical protein